MAQSTVLTMSEQPTGVNTPLERPNPFDTPPQSSRSSHRDAPASPEISAAHKNPGHYFQSRRVRKAEMERPQAMGSLAKKSIFQRQSWLIPGIGVLLGLAIAAFLTYWDLSKHDYNGNFCPVFSEDFSSGQLSPSVWTIEQSVGGFGNGEFDQTTDEEDVLFIKDGVLSIKPKLQDEKLVETQNASIDLGKACTGTAFFSCFAQTNITNGTIVPPVKSARINTKKGASIKYGRVEVVAKMPKGDWLWPAIWMLPTDEKYGAWPMSGEIDIAETRGNNHSYNAGPGGGNNIVASALHWGPDFEMDSYLQTVDQLRSLHSSYADDFHTFGLQWTETHLFTYVDSVLRQVLYVPFNRRFWERGRYPAGRGNGTAVVDPWSHTGRMATPFDERFYLVLNVAVGGTNGFFPDQKGGKPWSNASPVARKEFWEARDQWAPTWQKGGEMQIKSVKMWEKC